MQAVTERRELDDAQLTLTLHADDPRCIHDGFDGDHRRRMASTDADPAPGCTSRPRYVPPTASAPPPAPQPGVAVAGSPAGHRRLGTAAFPAPGRTPFPFRPLDRDRGKGR